MSALTLIFIKFSNSVLCLAPLSFIFPDISSELSWCLHTLLDVYVKFVYWLSCFDLFVHCCNACIHMLTSASAVIHLMRPKTYLDIPHTPRCLRLHIADRKESTSSQQWAKLSRVSIQFSSGTFHGRAVALGLNDTRMEEVAINGMDMECKWQMLGIVPWKCRKCQRGSNRRNLWIWGVLSDTRQLCSDTLLGLIFIFVPKQWKILRSDQLSFKENFSAKWLDRSVDAQDQRIHTLWHEDFINAFKTKQNTIRRIRKERSGGGYHVLFLSYTKC